jgi:hypothetical protein
MTILIQPINVSDVCTALQAQLQEWPGLEGRPKVERGEPAPEQPEKCPWIGIYRVQQVFEPRTLGLGGGYRRQRITLAVVMRESASRGQDCEVKMEKLVSETVAAICSDESVRGTVLAFGEEPFNLSYSSYSVQQNSFFQEAVLTFTVVTNVNATVS